MIPPPALFLALLLPALAAASPSGSSNSSPNPMLRLGVATSPGNGGSSSGSSAAEMRRSLDRLTQSNRELLDLLKQQQTVLEDMQYDRRLQSRQIQSLEERLEEALMHSSQLESKVASLEAAAALGTSGAPAAPSMAQANPVSPAPSLTTILPAPAAPTTFLPPPDSDGPPGTKTWHRLFTLKGSDGENSDLFAIRGRTWRVLWHNLDKPGKPYQNTSALFVSAFPKDDTIPQKVCSKLGSGGDATELDGPGKYYLKVEASGGSWELAVEDFR